MKTKLKKIIVPFILMMIFDLANFNLTGGGNFSYGLDLHIGLYVVSGLIFGPYGALGSIIGNLICDLIRGYNFSLIILSDILGFAISILAYKLWYTNLKGKFNITKPKLDNTYHLILFLAIIFICGSLFSVVLSNILYITEFSLRPQIKLIVLRYFFNFVNSSFILGILGIWISKKIDFVHIPKTSQKSSNKILYNIIFLLLILSLFTIIINSIFHFNEYLIMLETLIQFILLFAYLTKKLDVEINEISYTSITERVMDIFLFVTLIIASCGFIMFLTGRFDYIGPLLSVDILILIFFIPSFFVIKYIEIKVIEPIVSFSEIENFIKKDEKMGLEGLINIYSRFVGEDNEIGILARSSIDLVKYNNYYIENIRKIESEKERIKTELNLAKEIQESNLPKEAIENDDFTVFGVSKPAKEVGGDFFDYYMIDEDNLAVVIGDASGKGVPAAILSTVTQVIIKQLLKMDKNPSRVLYLLNNELCHNNELSMFITLWLGIYNKKTNMITFSNAGHNPPLMRHKGKIISINIDTGIVLGVMDDFEFTNDQIKIENEFILYTDGITDANNEKDEMYGEQRLIDFFNSNSFDEDIIERLLDNIYEFIGNQEQFDDMTVLIFNDKHD